MRAYLAIAVAILLVSAIVAQPVMAMVIAIPFITTDCAVFTYPVSSTALTVLEFNSQSATTHDAEDLNISFPLFSNDIVAGPSLGSFTGNDITPGIDASANVLPFGPVDLAFPSIAQTVNQSCASQRTYFYTDTFS